MLNEFKKFILRGNVIDLAVAVIIGAAFGKIITSMVNDILMPPLGLLMGKVDFSELYINLGSTDFESLKAATDAGAPVIKYGVFINNVLDFVIVAFCIFLVVRAANKAMELAKKKEAAAEPAPPSTKDCPHCLSAIPVKATKCAHCTSAV